MMGSVTTLSTPAERALLDQSVAETALPAHLLTVMHIEARQQGFQFRADIIEKLNGATETALAPLPTTRMLNVAKKLDGDVTAMLRDVGVTDAVAGFVIAARFCLLLVDEGHLADKNNMAVLVSLLVMDEAKEYECFFHFKYDERKVKSISQNLLLRAQMLGYYKKRLDQKTQIPGMGAA